MSLCLLLQTAEEDAYDFFTSTLDGDIFDHSPLPRHTNDEREEGPPPAADAPMEAEGDQQDDVRSGENEMEEGNTSALLEQQVYHGVVVVMIVHGIYITVCLHVNC